MARYKILAWREIPTQIQATDETGIRAKRPMPKWFMHEVSRTTMREGLAGNDDYLEEFAWSGWVERPGTADEVADAVYAELCAKFGRDLTGRRIARRGDATSPAGAGTDDTAGDDDAGDEDAD